MTRPTPHEDRQPMTSTATSQQVPSVNQPEHPLPAMTTYELRDYRRDLEIAIAFFGRQAPVPPARDRLQATLDDVIAEQDDRKRLACASP
jgi:hypothetical protein